MMHVTKAKIDVSALHAALDAERQARDLSWRSLAKEIGVSPSLLSRIGNDLRPDADGFATLVRWLNMPAETFMVDTDDERAPQRKPDLLTELAPLLRARQDLDGPTIEYIEEVVRAAVRHAQAAREGTA